MIVWLLPTIISASYRLLPSCLPAPPPGRITGSSKEMPHFWVKDPLQSVVLEVQVGPGGRLVLEVQVGDHPCGLSHWA